MSDIVKIYTRSEMISPTALAVRVDIDDERRHIFRQTMDTAEQLVRFRLYALDWSPPSQYEREYQAWQTSDRLKGRNPQPR